MIRLAERTGVVGSFSDSFRLQRAISTRTGEKASTEVSRRGGYLEIINYNLRDIKFPCDDPTYPQTLWERKTETFTTETAPPNHCNSARIV